jgi:HEAT repeat protein
MYHHPDSPLKIVEGLPETISAFLSSPKFSDREQAIRLLDSEGNTAAIEQLGILACKDDNHNLRKQAIQTLENIGNDQAHLALMNSLKQNTEFFLLRATVQGLAVPGFKAAVEPVTALLLKSPDPKTAFACLDCLFAINPEDFGKTLDQIIHHGLSGPSQGYLLRLMGETGDSRYAEKTVPFIQPETSEKTRLAALSALSRLDFNTFVTQTKKMALSDKSRKIRLRIAQSLGSQCTPEGIMVLWQQLLSDPDAQVKQEAMVSLGSFNDFDKKHQALIDLIKQSRPTRSSLETEWIIQALLDKTRSIPSQKDKIAGNLVETATSVDKTIIPVLAGLLIAAADKNTAKAGAYIDQIQSAKAIAPEKLEPLRVHVGGEQALNPLFKKLEDDLKKYFQDPIHKLNQQTRTEWERTILSARAGYIIRMAMSCMVFLAGMVMLIVSFYLFVTNQLSGTQLWGTSASFVSGLGATLLVIYTGPLKDIRSAVSDMGASNAAFIAYIHRILQISHTFSALYLNQAIDFKITRQSCDLINQAMTSTVSKLEFKSANKPSKPADPGNEDT